MFVYDKDLFEHLFFQLWNFGELTFLSMFGLFPSKASRFGSCFGVVNRFSFAMRFLIQKGKFVNLNYDSGRFLDTNGKFLQ